MNRSRTAAAAVATTLALATPVFAVSVLRGPYLQTPTDTSIVVRWRTDVPTSSRVVIGPAPGSLATNFDDATPATDHVVTVGGLTQGTYYYAIGSIAGAFVGDDADHFFRTADAGARTPFRIWSIGDAGFMGPTLDAVRDAFKAYNGGTSATDLFLLLGDNAYGVPGPNYLLANDLNYQTSVFQEHAEMLRSTPVYSTFGNHERFASQDLTQTGDYFAMFSFPTLAEAGGVASGTEAYYSFDFHNAHVVVLDSEDFATSAPAATPMLTWLQADLAATTADWVIAVWHRPPYTRGLLHNSDTEVNEINMRVNVVPVLESLGVDLVLCGHSHSYERSYFINGHYGLANTFTDAMKKDLGDGDPASDGAYRKPGYDGPLAANAGAVYVVNGSGSEVRNTTLDHPAHFRGLLEAGSLVVDVNQNVLTARFLTSLGAVHDTFTIVKGTACQTSPVPGCGTSAKSRVAIKTNANPTKNKWAWKWNGGTLASADFGDPKGETDLQVCVYDATGALTGGSLLQAGASWRQTASGWVYADPLRSRFGIQKIKAKLATGPTGQLQVKAKGSGIGGIATPVSGPLTVQAVNLDDGTCWQSAFSTFNENVAGLVAATLP